jgi:hypothetical protein
MKSHTMKHRVVRAGVRTRLTGGMLALLTLVTLVSLTGWPVVAQALEPGVYPPDAEPFRRTYAEWSALWWKWVVAIPHGVNPLSDPDGTQCAIGQQGPVWFLAGTGGGPATRSCTIPAGKAILFPIINFLNDYPCPKDLNFEPAPGQTLEAFLQEGAKDFVDQADVLRVTVDGNRIRGVRQHRAVSKLFSFTAAADNAVSDACLTGSPQLGTSDGYWIMLQPLPPGQHTLSFKGTTTGGFSTEVTYTLSIE